MDVLCPAESQIGLKIRCDIEFATRGELCETPHKK